MKKFYKIIAITLCTAMFTTGCQSNKMPVLTEEQTKLVTEYAASLILKHDKSHSSGIASQKEKDKAEKEQARALKRLETAKALENNKEGEAKTKTETAEPAPTYVELAQFLELEGTTIEYQGFEICDSYPDKSSDETSFAIDAEEGSKLLVVKFNLSTAEDKEVDLLSKFPIFRISINEGRRKGALTTMLLNDLSTYKATVTAGTPVEVVLVMSVTPEEAEGIQSLVLTTKYNDKSADTLLQ